MTPKLGEGYTGFRYIRLSVQCFVMLCASAKSCLLCNFYRMWSIQFIFSTNTM